jgi:hypothetical protein
MKKYNKFWKQGRYCRQDNLDPSRLSDGVIRARVDGKWQKFCVRSLPVSFMEWNLKERLKTLEAIGKGRMPSFAGPHSGMVASRGFKRTDSGWSLNNAVKGMGFLPKPESVEMLLGEMRSSADSSMEFKLKWLTGLYGQRKDLLDDTKQVSLELYAAPDYATHTFLNLMTDPAVSIVYLDIPSYEVRAVAQLMDPNDPGLDQASRNIVEYVNGIHDYFHGRSPRSSIVAVYHVIEVFDNSPGRARGRRVVPPLP